MGHPPNFVHPIFLRLEPALEIEVLQDLFVQKERCLRLLSICCQLLPVLRD